ncbi:MAG: hypothetical protein L0Y58_08420 [Verrucomicrobia subdivision 3 bacterium]|nr:hypothetical protein [Limisphaerales bacterium]
MAARLGVLIVHGMGSQTRERFDQSTDALIRSLERRVVENGADAKAIAWQRAFWGDILQRNQEALLGKLGGLNWTSWRRFVINNLGDAVAYQRQPSQRKDFYFQIHDRIHECLIGLRGQLGHGGLLVVMAHSLGSYIMSNYIWDRQQPNPAGDGYGATPFERLETLASIITFGSNIAVFSLALDPYAGFEFPRKTLPPHIADAARWLNFYDSDDVLGYPVKPLCPEYLANPRIEDRKINVGGWFSSWNPLSHNEYWADDDFIDPVARQLAALLRLAA